MRVTFILRTPILRDLHDVPSPGGRTNLAIRTALFANREAERSKMAISGAYPGQVQCVWRAGYPRVIQRHQGQVPGE